MTGTAARPLVSVVIPNHDYGRYVDAAIDSVLAQDLDGVEVVVIDNGSTDDSRDVLQRYHDTCRVIEQTDRGQAGGRNRGVLESSGRYVAFLDADDVWLPGKLAAQLAVLESDPAVGLVYCGMQEVDGDLEHPVHLQPRFRGSILRAFAEHPSQAIVLGGESTAVVRRTALADVGLFDPSLSISAGWDLWRRVASRHLVDFVDEPLVLYRNHGGNAHRSLDVYGRDLRRAVAKMFDDPYAAEVRSLRRRSTASVEMMLARSHAGRRQWAGALRHAVRWATVAPSWVGARG